LVEQWIENPCVPGSIPGETTKGNSFYQAFSSMLINQHFKLVKRVLELKKEQWFLSSVGRAMD
jgi:hypothetical protein